MNSLTLADRIEAIIAPTGTYAVSVDDGTAKAAALALARGSYQADLVRGVESLSGSTLKGSVAKYGPRYADSRRNFLSRCTAAGIPWHEAIGPRGRRVLVWGATRPSEAVAA